MATSESRLERVENEIKFRLWIRRERVFENMSPEELLHFARGGQPPNRPEPGPGESRLDTMDRKTLLRLWKEDEDKFAGRNREELAFYARYGHFPEQPCRQGNCGQRCC